MRGKHPKHYVGYMRRDVGPEGRRGASGMTIRVPIRGREKLAQLLCAQEGFVAVMMALVISALIGVAGLATETGMWYALKRQNQTAADAAALTAAFEYAGQIVIGVTTSPSAAATSTAASNQFSTSAPNAVAVNTPCAQSGTSIVPFKSSSRIS